MAISSGRKPPIGRIHSVTTDGVELVSPEAHRRPPLPTSRMPSQSSMDSGGWSAMSSASNPCAEIDRLHYDKAKGEVFPPSKWGEEGLHDGPNLVPAVTPVAPLSIGYKPSFTVVLGQSLYPPPPIGLASGIPLLPGPNHGLVSSESTGHLDLKHLMPASVRRPSACTQPDAYHSGTLSKSRPSIQSEEPRGKPPASIYLVNAAVEQHNRFFGAVYGAEHIPERETAMALLLELNRRHEVLYTPEVIHMAFEAMARNFIDLVEEGIRRTLRVTRRGIRRESLSEYALLPIDDGSPARVFPNSFDMQYDIGFWRSKFTPRFDAKFENGLINNALKSGLSPPSSTTGESSQIATGMGGQHSHLPIPGLSSED